LKRLTQVSVTRRVRGTGRGNWVVASRARQ